MDGAGADGRDGGRRAVRRPPTVNRTSTAPPSGGAVEVPLAVGGLRTARRPGGAVCRVTARLRPPPSQSSWTAP